MDGFYQGRNVTWDEPSKRGIGMVFQSMRFTRR